MTGVSVEDLLRAPVRLRGIQLGRPVDVIFDKDLRRAVGLEIHCRDDQRRFLPFAVATVDDGEVVIPSPLVLLDGSELAFYTERGATFRSLRNVDVEVRGVFVGTLEDLDLQPDGAIAAVVVAMPTGHERVSYDDDVAFVRDPRSVRAAS